MGVTAAYDKFYFEITYLSDPSPIITLPCLSLSSKLKFGQDIKVEFAHLSRPWSIGWVALSFLVRPSVRPAMLICDQINTFFNIFRHKSLVLTQFHLILSSTKLYWTNTGMYQPVLPHTDPAPPSISQHRLLLTQYHQVPTSTTPHWPGTTKYQPVPTYTVVAWGLQTSAQFTLVLVWTTIKGWE